MKTRRQFLRRAIMAAAGTGVLLVAGDLAKASLIQDVSTTGSAVPYESPNSQASLIAVKVDYSLMAQLSGETEEDFVLQSPATLQDLIDTVIVRHPSLATMMPLMLILLDGIPAKPTAQLKDGDNVQFIPLAAGG